MLELAALDIGQVERGRGPETTGADQHVLWTFDRAEGFELLVTPPSDDQQYVQVYQVGPAFFSTMGMTIVEGRDFTDEDMSVRTPQATALR